MASLLCRSSMKPSKLEHLEHLEKVEQEKAASVEESRNEIGQGSSDNNNMLDNNNASQQAHDVDSTLLQR